VGVLEEQGDFASDDDTIYVPLTTAQTRFFPQRTLSGERPVAAIYVSVVDDTRVDAAIEEITDVLRERHDLAPDEVDDFQVTSQQAVWDIASQITGILTLFVDDLTDHEQTRAKHEEHKGLAGTVRCACTQDWGSGARL